MQYSSQQTRRRSPSLILLELERLPYVGVVSTKAQTHPNFCCEFYLVYCKFYLCFSLNYSLVLIAISHFLMPILKIFGFLFCRCYSCRSLNFAECENFELQIFATYKIPVARVSSSPHVHLPETFLFPHHTINSPYFLT